MATKNQNFENDCKKMHDSLLKQNYLIAQILAQKNKHERKKIKDTYMRMYNEDLVTSLQNAGDSTISSDLRSALTMWMLCPPERDAILVREALDDKQKEINYKTLIEIFVCTKSSHMAMIKQIYYEKFRRYLDQDVLCIEPPHPCQKILMALAVSHNAHHVDVSQHIAKCDSKRLYQTGEGSNSPLATDEAVVLEILSKRSISQLKLTFTTYKCIYGHNYTKFLAYQFSPPVSSSAREAKELKKGKCGEFEKALRVVVKCISNPPKYYAMALYGNLKVKVTNKDDVARIIMSRSGIDIAEIGRGFKNKYEMELRDAIIDSIQSGDYRDFLTALLSKSTNATSPHYL